MLFFNEYSEKIRKACVGVCVFSALALYSSSSLAHTVFIPVGRSSVVELVDPAKEIVVANPAIADVYVNDSKTLTVIGKSAGRTSIRVFDESSKMVRAFDISIGYDLPNIRKAIKHFLPDEKIGIEMVNSSVALTGEVRNNASIEKALKIVQEYVSSQGGDSGSLQQPVAGAGNDDGNPYPKIINMMKLVSGQQVMLRVKVAEVNRDALKRLGVDPQAVLSGGNFSYTGALGTAIEGIIADSEGSWTIDRESFRGSSFFGWRSDSNHRLGAAINALERDGLVKTLAEPNLVAASGEQAEFLAGGEIPVLTPSSSGTGGTVVTTEYKPVGVSVKFLPDVLSENRIRMTVQPEVSEVSTVNAVTQSGFVIPSINTRRAKTTVELAPGESFMIAGLIKDNMSSSIDQLPGMKELPVLGALFRSTEFKRNESELVITVTPYIVDPVKGTDIKSPTDDLRPASQMEMFFYGALGAITTDENSAYVPQLEGPTGFMVD